jgi:hypothetical protein
MEKTSQHLEDLKTIKSIMEQSSRFLSLSGLSGISAGLFAIAGAIAAKMIIKGPVINAWGYSKAISQTESQGNTIALLLLTAGVVLVLAVSSVLFFSYRKARKSGQKIWTPASKRLLINLSIPLAAGGLFILLTLGQLNGSIIAAATLVFYGLALVNAGKFTFGEIYWLGIMEIVTGLLCLAIPGYAFVFWVFGFGILHMGYGTFMYFKYR